MILKLRSVLFWMHLAVGVVVGLFILNMAASGILIAYQKQIVQAVEQGPRTVNPPAGAPRLEVEALVAKVQDERPQARLSAVTLFADPTSAVLFTVGKENNALFVNPYSGEITGEGQRTVRGFFQWMTTWHRWLALTGSFKSVGETVTGVVSIAYFALLLSGLVLWLPKRWSRSRVRQGALLNLDLRARARDWNWHNVIGLWCAPLLLIVALTAIILAHHWAGDLLFRITGNPVPEQRKEGRRGNGEAEGKGPAPKLDLSGVNSLWAQAQKQVPDWNSIYFRFPKSPEAPVTFQIDRGSGNRPDQMAQLTFDRNSGEVTRWQPYETQNAGQKLRSWVKPLHTGEAGGLFGESLAVIAALGGIILVWTGLSLAWRRFFGSRKSSGSPPESTPTPSSL